MVIVKIQIKNNVEYLLNIDKRIYPSYYGWLNFYEMAKDSPELFNSQ